MSSVDNMVPQDEVDIPAGLIPTYSEIMSQNPEIMAFRDLKKEESYAVTGFKFLTLNGGGGQVVVAKLWSNDQFPWSKNNTQFVWGVKLLKDLLVGDMKKDLPFWIGVGEEKSLTSGSYYPIRHMAFSMEQINFFPWAKEANEKAEDMEDYRDDSLSICSATSSRMFTPDGHRGWETVDHTFKKPRLSRRYCALETKYCYNYFIQYQCQHALAYSYLTPFFPCMFSASR